MGIEVCNARGMDSVAGPFLESGVASRIAFSDRSKRSRPVVAAALIRSSRQMSGPKWSFAQTVEPDSPLERALRSMKQAIGK